MPSAFNSIEEVDAQIEAYKEALKVISLGREYHMSDGKALTMPDLPEIRKTLRWLEREKVKLETGGGPFMLPGRPKR